MKNMCVQVKANCRVPPLPIIADNLKGSVSLTEAELIALVNNESALTVLPPTEFKILSPTLNALETKYTFYAGETYAIELQASNSVSTDVCISSISIGLDPDNKAQSIAKSLFPWG